MSTFSAICDAIIDAFFSLAFFKMTCTSEKKRVEKFLNVIAKICGVLFALIAVMKIIALII